MNTLTGFSSYDYATAVLGRKPGLLAKMQQANLLVCVDDPQDMRFRDSRLCVLRWVAEQRKERKVDVAWTIRPYRLMPYLPTAGTLMANKGFRGDALAYDADWPAWSDDVGVPPLSAAAQPMGDWVFSQAEDDCFEPWLQWPPCPYVVSARPGDVRFSSIVMQHNHRDWHDALANYLVAFSERCVELSGVQPVLLWGNYKLSSLIWPSNQWSIVPVDDPTLPNARFMRRRASDGVVSGEGIRTVPQSEITDGKCAPLAALDTLPIQGYIMLAEWHRAGWSTEGWREGTGSHFDWWHCSWADACRAQWVLPNKTHQVFIERGMKPLFGDERIFSEVPWRYSEKAPDIAGIGTAEIVRELCDLFDNKAWRYVFLPTLELEGKDAPAKELVEYLRSSGSKTTVVDV